MPESGSYMKGLTGLLLLAVVATGCRKEEDPAEFEKLSFDAGEVLAKLPSGLTGSNDPSAIECIGHIESALDMSAFITSMEVPADAEKSNKESTTDGDEWYWTLFHEGKNFTLYWIFDEDASGKNWSMEIQYGAGPGYDFIDAWESGDGSKGEVKYNFTWSYIDNAESGGDYQESFWQYSWDTDVSGRYMFNRYYESEDPGFNFYLHYELVINPDGSGTIDYFSLDSLFYHAEWDVPGNGSSIYYLGDFLQPGSWTTG